MTEPTVRFYFGWDSFMPDHRQFKQNSVVLTPQTATGHAVYVSVDVPNNDKYIANRLDVMIDELYAERKDCVLTTLGMRYCMDQLESVLPDVPLQAKDFDPDVEDEDGWDSGQIKAVDMEDGW